MSIYPEKARSYFKFNMIINNLNARRRIKARPLSRRLAMKDHFNNLAVNALRGLGVIFMTAGMFLGLESIQQDFTAAVNAHRCTSGFSVGMPPCADPAPAPLP